MKCRVQLIMETDTGEVVQEIACLERETARLEDVGVTLTEAKAVLAGIQQVIVKQQTADYVAQQRPCPQCGQCRRHKGEHSLTFRTLFGTVVLQSPRWHRCPCEQAETRTFSPLTALLTEHTSPERLYLETKWASLVSYGATVQLLTEVLPLDSELNAASVRNHLQHVAERAEAALGNEQVAFIEGCPRDWGALPPPPAPLTVGLDGGYVREWNDKHKHFEMIAGKSVPEEGDAKYFGFAHGYDQQSKRRLFELLQRQGMQRNQQVVFLTDGGDTLRDLPLYLNPESEHYLDWFHLTMRLTAMGQVAKGLGAKPDGLRAKALEHFESVKHSLWHGNLFQALETLEDLALDVEGESGPIVQKLTRMVREFRGYLEANHAYLRNFGEHWRNGETISTAFVESTVNAVVSKRFVKKQQMQWTERGAHLLLQMRVRVLDEDLDALFREWYPGFHPTMEDKLSA